MSNRPPRQDNKLRSNDSALIRARVTVRGIVQGVGFRPFVYRIATAHGLAGWVLNSTEGVEIEVEGRAAAIDDFLHDLAGRAPVAASVHRIDVQHLPPAGYASFAIERSQETSLGFPLVSPDIGTCPDCLAELFDPRDRRHGYPFINCTNCGPRFTIVEAVPYDRPRTTMKRFAMCASCRREYDDPSHRRFHAQPNACPECGPRVWLVDASTVMVGGGIGQSGRDPHPNPLPERERGLEHEPFPEKEMGLERERLPEDGGTGGDSDPIATARRLLKAGKIVAIKGLGGFHLACDATNATAVAELRARKRRIEKPFAVMVPDLAAARRFCYVDEAEGQLLASARRPIVLLARRPDGPVAAEVAPGSRMLGVFLPYTPIHHLLLAPTDEDRFDALVMTSGNLSEEPIASDNEEALARLKSLADCFLLHDRPIQVRCDDSVTSVFAGQETIIRRSRGYAPLPLRLDLSIGSGQAFDLEQVLACGAELKSTFCLVNGPYAFLSQHIGDLDNQETLDFFAEAIEHFVGLFDLRPRLIAHDLHPDYLSTRYSETLAQRFRSAARASIPLVGVQHHHAHIASCMAENGLTGQVIGVAFDGTGYGPDGTIWGGEFLIAGYDGFERVAHLRPVPLPGGDAAIRKPYRMAMSYLMAAYGDDLPAIDVLKSVDRRELDIIRIQVMRGLNSPLTSSCGRLFDAVSALLCIRREITYEGQAAVELEMTAAADASEAYDFALVLLPGKDSGVDTSSQPSCPRKRKSTSQGSNGAIDSRLRGHDVKGRDSPEQIRGSWRKDQPMTIDATPVIRAIVDDLARGERGEVIAAKFHYGVARMIAKACGAIRRTSGLNRVCLSGGVFQNHLLLGRALDDLRREGFDVYIHHQVPCNDGGISLGQAMVASEKMRAGRALNEGAKCTS